MTKTIAQRELRNDNARIMDEVAAGEDFIVTRNGLPIAELRPVSAAARQTFVTRDELLGLIKGSRAIDYQRFRADLDDAVDPGFS